MVIKKYGSIRTYENNNIALSPASKLLLWTFENPEKAIEIGAKIAVVGGLIWFLGALFNNK